jgi:hypothetical protein
MKHLRYFVVFIPIFLCTIAYGQNLEKVNIKKSSKGFFTDLIDADPFSISGNFGLNLRSYTANNIENRQSPFIWYLNSNLNVNIYKIRIPISAIVSTQNQTVSHPFHQETIDNLKRNRFTRIGASPYYKWVKMHFGHRSMNFSPLTMSNHVFFGAGLELNPGLFRFAGFYGRMAKTEPRDLSLFGYNQQVFSRKALGLKVGYGNSKNFLDLILFKANDDPSALDVINQDSTKIFQNENAVLAINSKANLFKRVNFNLEIAISGFTKNAVDPIISDAEFKIQNFALTQRTSTVYRKAINAGVTFNGDLFNLGLAYKRIEPEYRSLGTYFFNNDLENSTANLGFSLFSKKIRINATGGLQRNNLFGEKESQLTRTISSLNVNYAQNKLNVGLIFSNYASDISYVLNPDLDSLNAIIVTRNTSLNTTYSIGESESSKQIISLILSLQSVADDIEDFNRSSESQMINGILSYRFLPNDSPWKYNAMINYNQNEIRNIAIKRTGFGLGIEKVLIKDKVTVRVNSNYYISTGENINNKTLNLRLSIPFNINKKHKINFGAIFLNRLNSTSSPTADFQEFTSVLNYTYSF